jgi:hypothetical protein
MFKRREVLLGGLLTVVFGHGAGCLHCRAEAATLEPPDGCIVEEGKAAPYLALAQPTVGVQIGDKNLVASSGDGELDRAIRLTVDRLGRMFDVSAAFTYYDDAKAPNALATTARLMSATHGTVLFGRTYLGRLLQRPAHPDAAVAATLAHEWGHILQFKHRLRDRLLAGQPTVKRNELHADFMAGYYAGVRKRERADFQAIVFIESRYERGDLRTTNRNHHGTPSERMTAASKGFEAAFNERLPLTDAMQVGFNWALTT